MSRFVRLLAIVVGFSLLTATASAGVPAPVSVKAKFFSDRSGEASDLSSDDNNYYSLTSQEVPGPHKAGYVATFKDIDPRGVLPVLRFVGRAVTHDCQMEMAVYKWKTRKWVLWEDSTEVDEGAADVAREGTAQKLKPFVERGKLKARLECVSFGGEFEFKTDQLTLNWSIPI